MRRTRGDKRGRTLIGGALLLLLAAGCGRVASLEALPAEATGSPAASGGSASTAAGSQAETSGAPSAPAASASPARARGPQNVAVRRGTIAELLLLTGRVGGMEEVPLSFPLAGRAEAVPVKVGQAVEAGQVLLEADSKDIAKELNAARARLDGASARLEQTLAQADAQQRDALRRAAAERAQRDNAIAEAEAGVRRAVAELEKVKAGPSPADRQAAENAVETARANLARAEAAEARVMAGASPAELQKAEQDLLSARLALQRAEAEQARVTAGASPVELQKAEQDLLSARLALQK